MHDELACTFEPPALAELIDQFRAAIAIEAGLIGVAEREGDPEAAEAAAHRLVSAASQFGYPELAGLARAIESGEARTDQVDLPGALARADAAAARFIAECSARS